MTYHEAATFINLPDNNFPMASVPKKAVVKKKWVSILAGFPFENAVIGETYIAEPEKLVGRPVTVNMAVLTDDPQRQKINCVFKISKLDGQNLLTEFTGYHFIPSSLRKLVRRGKDKVEDSFDAVTADGKKLRVKPFIITRGKIKGSVAASLHKAQRAFLLKTISSKKFEELVRELVQHKIQHELSAAVKKIYPAAAAEIRWLQKIGEEKVKTTAEKTEAANIALESPQPAAESAA